MTSNKGEDEELLTPAEVAHLFRVDVKTVARWAQIGRIPRDQVIITLGGHRRYKARFIRSLLLSEGENDAG
jgi:DNA-binding transcriptional MerR regulator